MAGVFELRDASPRAWWLGWAVAGAVLLLPLLMVDVPPLHDYPNHLARLFLLAGGLDDPLIARFYRSNWSVIPDLGIDVLGPPLARWLPVHIAGRIVVGVVLLLPVLGAVAYALAATNRRSWWALGAALVAYNQAFLLGFLNFTAGIGLGMLAAAVWLRWREAYPARVLFFSAIALVGLFFCHLMGVVVFAILIGAHELAWAIGARPALPALLARWAAGASVFLAPLGLHVFSHFAGEPIRPGYADPWGKARGLLAPWVNYDWRLDAGTALLCVLCGAVLLWQARRTMPVRAWITLGVVVLLYLATPEQLSGVHNFDMRFAVLFGFLLFAGWAPARLPGWMMAALGAVFAARMAMIVLLWQAHGTALASLRAVIAAVPEGSLVLSMLRPAPDLALPSARRLASGEEMDAHLPALLLIERKSWWPFLFDNPSQQPVTSRPAFAALTRTIEQQRRSAAICGLGPVDHVLVLGLPLPEQEGVHLLAGSDVAWLYRHEGAQCIRMAGE